MLHTDIIFSLTYTWLYYYFLHIYILAFSYISFFTFISYFFIYLRYFLPFSVSLFLLLIFFFLFAFQWAIVREFAERRRPARAICLTPRDDAVSACLMIPLPLRRRCRCLPRLIYLQTFFHIEIHFRYLYFLITSFIYLFSTFIFSRVFPPSLIYEKIFFIETFIDFHFREARCVADDCPVSIFIFRARRLYATIPFAIVFRRSPAAQIISVYVYYITIFSGATADIYLFIYYIFSFWGAIWAVSLFI